MKRDEKIVDFIWDALRQYSGLSTVELAHYGCLSPMEVASALSRLRREGKARFWRGRRWRKAGAGTELFWSSIR